MLTSADYESLNSELESSGWQRISFDGGQSHLMGWSIIAVWALDKARITLTHSERYNQVSYEIEANPFGFQWLQTHGYAHVFDD